MLATGRALMSNPRLLPMDEPSIGLASAIVEQNFELIRRANDQTPPSGAGAMQCKDGP